MFHIILCHCFRKRSSTQASLNSAHKDESANKMISKGSKSKLPPPRPPPPYVSVTKAQVESVLSKQCDQKEITNPGRYTMFLYLFYQ